MAIADCCGRCSMACNTITDFQLKKPVFKFLSSGFCQIREHVRRLKGANTHVGDVTLQVTGVTLSGTLLVFQRA